MQHTYNDIIALVSTLFNLCVQLSPLQLLQDDCEACSSVACIVIVGVRKGNGEEGLSIFKLFLVYNNNNNNNKFALLKIQGLVIPYIQTRSGSEWHKLVLVKTATAIEKALLLF
jgi:hypothetical protein